METVVVFGAVSYAEPPLRLGTAQKECPRRDSLSSSRTGDSGYLSDVEMGPSPLEVCSPWQLPHTSSDFTCDSSALFEVKGVASSRTKRLATTGINPAQVKRYKTGQEGVSTPRIEVTSNPTTAQDQSTAAVPRARSASRNEDIKLWVKDNLHPQACPKERNLSIISLSSTGSCDMYSATEDNSDDEQHPPPTAPTLSKSALKTIQLIMRKIELHLNHAAYTHCAGTHSSRTQSTTTSSSSTHPSRSTAHPKRKSHPSTTTTLPPHPNDDSDSDTPPKRRRISIATTTSESDSGPRFACPFYKHDPLRYRHRRTCGGPGWPTVHRMKEHLYRSHAQPIFCPRCYTVFDADADFFTHLRGEPCATAAPQPIEGIDRKTFEGLKKRCNGQRLEEDRWRDVYALLFPGVSSEEVPSPYYDADPPTEASRQFRRALLERVRTELLRTAEREPAVEQRLLRQVAGIIRRCEAELRASAYPGQHLPAPSLDTGRRSSAIEVQNPPASSFDTTRRSSAVDIPVVEAPAQHRQPVQLGPVGSTEAPGGLRMRGDGMGQQGFAGWESLPFELIDWDVAFPPGLGVDGQGGGGESEGAYLVLNNPVWTT